MRLLPHFFQQLPRGDVLLSEVLSEKHPAGPRALLQSLLAADYAGHLPGPGPGKTPYSFPTSDASDVLGFAFLAGSAAHHKKKTSKDVSTLRRVAFLIVAVVLLSCSKAKQLDSVPTPSTS